MAPPVLSPFEEFIKTKGWQNTGSYLNLQGNSCLVRSDLRIDVPLDFWVTFKEINVQSLYKQLSQQNDVIMIFAEKDQVLGQQPFIDAISSDTVPDADHDFSGRSRKALLNLIAMKLQTISNL